MESRKTVLIKLSAEQEDIKNGHVDVGDGLGGWNSHINTTLAAKA